MKKIIIIILILVLIISAFNYKLFYYRFYRGDRITGTFEISANNKNISNIDEYYEYERCGHARLTNDTHSFKIKGGGYGTYIIGFLVSGNTLYDVTEDEFFKDCGDIDFQIDCFNTNWWHIINLDIKIDVIKEEDVWYACYNVDVKKPSKNYKTTTYNVSKKERLTDNGSTRISIEI
ncbi:MAG: hypothetical protein J5590_02980 [Clostridia bacterium]|nr:hypothetical protein [Clostridia bacterium]